MREGPVSRQKVSGMSTLSLFLFIYFEKTSGGRGERERERMGADNTGTQPETAPTGCYKCGRPGHWSSDCPAAGGDRAIPHASSRGSRPEAPRPTGCFKCGRPGHWSRDCPGPTTGHPSSDLSGKPAARPIGKTSQPPKKVPRERPKLTPQILLSDDGLGYILRHFPRAFKPRGRGHEVGLATYL